MSDLISSLPSPKIRFRELDVEFLQKQARIWLEAVVGERYDQNTSLPGLLADGEILRKVSSKIWEFIQKHADKDSTFTGSLFPEASSNGKLSGRYLPYSNIDAFLKVCQKLGLTGVDLFSPPDVVEEKDIRRVCLCIRALSQKARARNVKVPNFDYVTHNEVIPTGIVGSFKALHLNAEIIESKDTPEKVSRSPLLQKRWTDHKGNNGPASLASVEIAKEKESVSSSLVTDACPRLNGKSLKTTMNVKRVPLSSSEEVSKSTNDSKVILAKEETTVYYEGFKHKVNRALFQDDENLKQGLHLNKQLLSTPEAEEEVISDTTSSNEDNLGEILCTMDSFTDTSKSPCESMDGEEHILEQSVGKNPSGKRDQGKLRRRRWPVVIITMAMLGAVLIFRRREARVYRTIGKDGSLLQISGRDGNTKSRSDIPYSDQSMEVHT
eukprot:c29307_g1_i1 orf=213-1526(+)